MGIDYDDSRSLRKRKVKRKSKAVLDGSSGRMRLPKNYFSLTKPGKRVASSKKKMSSYERVIDNPGSNMSVSQSLVIPYAGDAAVINNLS